MIAHGIDLNTPEIEAFCRRWKIRELSVFGSILRDDFRPDSDIDFLADYEDDAEWDLLDHLHMVDELAALLGREVDVLDREGVESSGNRFLKREIFGTARPVHAT